MDVGSSAKGAARYMSDLLKMFGGNLPMAFASYNWGEGNVQKYLAGKVKAMPKETRGYIEGTAKWRKAAGGGDYVATQTMAESQMDEYAKKIREQIALIGKKTEVEKQAALISIGKYGELTQAEKDSILNNAKLIDQENKKYDEAQRYSELVEQITQTKAIESYTQDLALIEQAWKEGKISAEQYNLAVIQAKQNAPHAMGEEFGKLNDWILEVTDTTQEFGDLYANTFSSMSDAMAKFVTTGKLEFSDLANSIIADLARIAMNQAVGNIASGLFGMFGGGAFAPTSSLPSFNSDLGLGNSFLSGGGIGMMKLFASGGYTGAGGKYEPAGIVHKGEVVFSQDDVSRLGGVGRVEQMRLRGYANGGIVGASPSGSVSSGGVVIGDIIVPVSGGGKSEGVSDKQTGQLLGGIVRAAVNDALVTEMRPGGRLYGRV